MKIKAKNKKQYWLQVIGYMSLGGVIGFLSVLFVDRIGEFIKNNINLDTIYLIIGILLPISCLIFIVISMVYYSKYKKIADKIDEGDNYDKANKLLDLSGILTPFALMNGFLSFCFLKFDSTYKLMHASAVIIIFMITFFYVLVHQQRMVKALENIRYIDKINVYDEDEMKNVTEKLDEAAKSMINEASFKAMKKIQGLLFGLLITTSLITMLFDIDSSYAVIIGGLTLTIYGIYSVELFKIEHGKKEK